ncbi:hypothetical protein ABPG75_006123 [Micractinium tetrahymenae]
MTWLAYLAVLSSLLAAAAALDACGWSDTYPSYQIIPASRPGGQSKFKEVVKGNLVNLAYKQAVSLTTWRLRRGGYISYGCKVLSTVKARACYDSSIPGRKGRQVRGRYGFNFSVLYSCPTSAPAFDCSARLYVTRYNRPWHKSFWRSPQVDCSGTSSAGSNSGHSNIIPKTAPTMPTITKIDWSGSTTSAYVTLTANPPSIGAPILSYTLTAVAARSSSYATVTLPGLTYSYVSSRNQVQVSVPAGYFQLGATKYWYTLQARNSVGLGPKSPAFLWPTGPPAAPTIKSISSSLLPTGEAQVLIEAALPTFYAGITGYIVKAVPKQGSKYVTIVRAPDGIPYKDSTRVTLMVLGRWFDLANLQYDWTVSFKTALTNSAESNAWLFPEQGRPAAPSVQYVTEQYKKEWVVGLRPPSWRGGTGIYVYKYLVYVTRVWDRFQYGAISVRPKYPNPADRSQTELRFSSTGFAPGYDYSFIVVAVNTKGFEGYPSDAFVAKRP